MARPEHTLDIHIASWLPARWDEIDEIRAGPNPLAFGSKRRPTITTEELDWPAIGLVPRWLGEDSSEAVAALDPSIFTHHGASEWNRLVDGAARRGDLVLAVSMVGSDDDPDIVQRGGPRASVRIPAASSTNIGGQRIALARRPDIAAGIGRADRDLALRIADTRPGDLPWWVLGLSGDWEEDGRRQRFEHPPAGTLEPLLVSPAGETVAAVWISPDRTVRHYVLPAMPSWQPVLDWLVRRAIPEFVPGAARRMKSSLSGEAALQTPEEATARAQIAELDATYEARRADLAEQIATAERSADEVRYPLLYEAGTPLVNAVARVLADAGIEVTDLDNLLGSTSNADLLAQLGDLRILVEVKSSGGAPAERLAEAPARHLATWPQLRPNIPVDGTAMIVNHQTSTHPLDRDALAYRRPEFVDSLTFPVVTTRELFDWWRTGDMAALRAAIFGIGVSPAAAPTALPQPANQPLRRRRLLGRRVL